MMRNGSRDDGGDDGFGDADDADYRRTYRKIVAGLSRLEALDAPPNPVKAMREVMDLVERALKIQCLLRKAYPKRSRLARRRRKSVSDARFNVSARRRAIPS